LNRKKERIGEYGEGVVRKQEGEGEEREQRKEKQSSSNEVKVSKAERPNESGSEKKAGINLLKSFGIFFVQMQVFTFLF
jgi:hypothetical protein